MQQRLPSLLDDPIAFGHRGARAHLPENTLDSFALALRLGASGLESDVWLTADGVPVLDHDGIARRSLGRTVAIASVDRAALPSHIPTLAELLDRCGPSYDLSLDLKDPAAGQPVVDVVREAAPSMLERVWLCERVWQRLLPLRGSGVQLVDSTRLARIKEGPERRVATLRNEGVDVLNMHHRDWNGGLVSLAHRFQRCAFAWDLQDPFDLANALRMGVDAIYSDWPDRMMDVYKEVLGTAAPPRS